MSTHEALRTSCMLLVALLVALTVPVEAQDRLLWRASIHDLDGDGYADAGASSNERELVSVGSPLEVPPGWVAKRGDLDDNDPNVHPRRSEVPGNGIDDNCDGRIDEPIFLYAPGGFDSRVNGFSMHVVINDPEVVGILEAMAGPAVAAWLSYEVEYQRLRHSGRTPVSTGILPITSMKPLPTKVCAEVSLSGLDPARVYRARIQFYRTTVLVTPSGPIPQHTPVGEQSGWYHTMTLGGTDLGLARARIVLRGFFEKFLSDHGVVGYAGISPDGTRYGGDIGEAWCSEFYSFVADSEIRIGQQDNFVQVESWFFGEGALTSVTVPAEWIDLARPGDYLASDTTGDGSKNHSSMFLAYDEASDILWTLDGNADGKNDFGSGGWEWRRGGSEVVVREADATDIRSLGRIRAAMLP